MFSLLVSGVWHISFVAGKKYRRLPPNANAINEPDNINDDEEETHDDVGNIMFQYQIWCNQPQQIYNIPGSLKLEAWRRLFHN